MCDHLVPDFHVQDNKSQRPCWAVCHDLKMLTINFHPTRPPTKPFFDHAKEASTGAPPIKKFPHPVLHLFHPMLATVNGFKSLPWHVAQWRVSAVSWVVAPSASSYLSASATKYKSHVSVNSGGVDCGDWRLTWSRAAVVFIQAPISRRRLWP